MPEPIPAKIVNDPGRVHQLFQRYAELDRQALELMRQESRLQKEKKRIADALAAINPTNLSPGEIVRIARPDNGRPWRGCVQAVELNSRRIGNGDNGRLLEFVAVVTEILRNGKPGRQVRRVPLGLIDKLRDTGQEDGNAPQPKTSVLKLQHIPGGVRRPSRLDRKD
jgi:hypothetical protein